MAAASVQEIVYAFLQTYYQRMKSNPSKLSNLYSTTAELTHINYTQITSSAIHLCNSNDNNNDSNDKNSSNNNSNNAIDMIPTIKLTGKDNISKFFTRHENKVNKLKIRLDTCDFQTMGAAHKNILIVVTGELFWDGTPSYQFCQTFVLIPIGKSSDIYDISNDIIRFIPDTFKEIQTIYEENSTELDNANEKSQVRRVDSVDDCHDSTPQAAQKENIIVNKKKEDDIIKDKSFRSGITGKENEPNHQGLQQKPEEKESQIKKDSTSSSSSSSSSSSLHIDDQETITVQTTEPLQSNKQKDDSTEEFTKKESEKKKISEKKDSIVKDEIESTVTKDQSILLEKKELNASKDTNKATIPDVDKDESSIDKEESSILEVLSSPISSTTVSQSQTPQPLKLSWASKLSSAEPTKESKKILVAKTTAATKIVIPETISLQHQHHHNQHKNNSNNGSSKKNANTNDKKFEMGSRKDNNSNRRDRRKQQNSNSANKEGYYPVFINGTYGIDDEALKNTLSKAFGIVVKINSGENFAVVDFQTYNSQVAALEMKKMMIQGFEISIERKTSKKGNLQHNSSNRTTSPDGFISSTKTHRKYQNNNNNGKKRESGNY